MSRQASPTVQVFGPLVIANVGSGYFSSDEKNCGEVGTIAVTVVAGPLNYVGVNPKVEDCDVPEAPQPST